MLALVLVSRLIVLFSQQQRGILENRRAFPIDLWL